MAKATKQRKAARKRPDSATVAAALARAQLKRAVQAQRDISRLIKELRRAHERAYDVTQTYATELLEGRGYDVVPRRARAGEPETADGEQ
jgi:hypothetical protein